MGSIIDESFRTLLEGDRVTLVQPVVQVGKLTARGTERAWPVVLVDLLLLATHWAFQFHDPVSLP